MNKDLISKLIDNILLGKNKKQLRILAAFIVKGIYETNNSFLTSAMIEKLVSVKQYGVNSQEFLAVFAYIVNRERHLGNLNDQ